MKSRSRMLGVVLILGAMAVVTTRLGAHVSPSGVLLHGCLTSDGSLVKLSAADANCKGTQMPIHLLSLGNDGVIPEDNLPPAPPSGITGYQRVLGTPGTATDGFAPTLVATCPAGKKVLGGGPQYIPDFIVSGGQPYVIESHPISDTTWQTTVGKLVDGTPAFMVRAVAVCADAS